MSTRLERALARERRVRVLGERVQLAQEPEVDRRALVHLLERHATARKLEDRLEALGGRDEQALQQLLVGDAAQPRRLVELP